MKREYDDDEILSLIGAEMSSATNAETTDGLEDNRQNALAAYLGKNSTPAPVGRSQIVSTDVADAVEWIMPEIVKAFTQNDDVVTFDPEFQGDEAQAELESQYVYDILMKRNDGYSVIYEAAKDALLYKNCYFKVFYETEDSYETEVYSGLSEEEANIILADENVELSEMTDDNGVVELKIRRNQTKPCIRVLTIPPEELRFSAMYAEHSFKRIPFIAHTIAKREYELVDEGYDPEIVKELPDADLLTLRRSHRFSMQEENAFQPVSSNSDFGQRMVEISECYVHLDLNGDGFSEYLKITVGGSDNPTAILDIEEIDANPFINGAAILMPHKAIGLSVYDRLRELQQHKTTLMRNIMDNTYLQNNQRTVVAEGQVNLDDLLSSRVGGIVRAANINAVAPLATPNLPSDAYKLVDYLDRVRAGRAGVSPEGAVTDNMIGDRVGSQGVEKMLNQKEELVGLMVRTIAETAIKPLCYMIRELARKHLDTMEDYRFRGLWLKVNPSQWRNRTHTTVRVGTGSGNRSEQRNVISQILQLQLQLRQDPSQAIVDDQQIFNSVNALAKYATLPSATPYVLDPRSPEAQTFKQSKQQAQQQAQQMQMQMQQVQAEATTKIANAEEQKAKVDGENVQLKAQLDSMKNQISLMKEQGVLAKQQHELELKRATLDQEREKTDKEFDFKYWEAGHKYGIEREKLKKVEAKDAEKPKRDE